MRLQGIFLSLLVILCLGGCQNNGDIGLLFGEWAIDDVTVDGQRVDDYQYGKTYLRFQNNIVAFNYMADPNMNYDYYVGTWTRTDDTLTLDFNHKFRPNEPSGNIPPEFLIPPMQSTTFTIDRETSKALVITYVDAENQPVTFSLRKLN